MSRAFRIWSCFCQRPKTECGGPISVSEESGAACPLKLYKGVCSAFVVHEARGHRQRELVGFTERLNTICLTMSLRLTPRRIFTDFHLIFSAFTHFDPDSIWQSLQMVPSRIETPCVGLTPHYGRIVKKPKSGFSELHGIEVH